MVHPEGPDLDPLDRLDHDVRQVVLRDPDGDTRRAADIEGSPRKVTRWYPATEREVRDAIAFERRLAGPPARRMAA